MQRTHRLWLRLAAVLALGAMLLAACASDGGGDGGGEGASPDGTQAPAIETSKIQPGWVNEADPEATTGGILDLTLVSPLSGLDPQKVSLGVTTGGSAIMAIYDTLLRWDPDTNDYEPRLAESLEANDDFSVWTLKLKPDVQFSNGDPITSTDVQFSIERMAQARGVQASYPAYFASYETPDPQTLVMNLVEPINNIDALMSNELGYIVPKALVEADPDGFNTNPVGAGPFMVQNYNPDVELNLVKNPNYSLGEVRLDGMHMTWNTDQGANVDKLINRETDVTFLTSVPSEVKAIDAGHPAYSSLVAGGGMVVNSAKEGFPGDDVRVRKAISMAVNTEQVNERVAGGEGFFGHWFFAPGTRYATENPWGSYDADEARRLLEEVKTETGWDGSFTLLTPQPNDQALAYQALLNSVGFNVDVTLATSFTELITSVVINRDYDVSIWVMSTYENNIYQSLSRSLVTGAAGNYSGYSDPELDALINEFRTTTSEDEVLDVLERMATYWQENVPFVLTQDTPFTTATGTNVGGLVPSTAGLILWDQAFLA